MWYEKPVMIKNSMTQKQRLAILFNTHPNEWISLLKKLDYEWWRISETKKYVKKVMRLYEKIR